MPNPADQQSGPEHVVIDAGGRAAHTRTGTASSQQPNLDKPLSLESRRNLLLACVVGAHLLPTFGGPPTAGFIWLLAGVALFVGLAVFRFVLEPGDDQTSGGLGAFFFTAIAGIVVLLLFQQAAEHASQMKATHVGNVKATILYWITKTIGYAYGFVYSADDPNAAPPSFLGLWLAMTVSVGLCEEFVKLLPVLWFFKNSHSKSLPNVLFVGAMSGLGFGISEGIFYSFNIYMPAGAPLSMYLFRFFACAFGHAVLTVFASVMAVKILGDKRGDSKLLANELGIIGGLAALASAVPHGLYNTFSQFGYNVPAGIVDAALVCIVASMAHDIAVQRRGYAAVCILCGILPFAGCNGNTASTTPPAPSPAVPRIDVDTFRGALNGKFEDVPGPQSSMSVSFRYPQYMRHTHDGKIQLGGMFEVFDDHWALRISGLYGTGAFAIAMEPALSAEHVVLLAKPSLTGDGRLQGIYVVGLYAQVLPEEKQFLLRYVGPPEVLEGKQTQPRRPILVDKMPEFMPRIGREKVDSMFPWRDAPSF